MNSFHYFRVNFLRGALLYGQKLPDGGICDPHNPVVANGMQYDQGIHITFIIMWKLFKDDHIKLAIESDFLVMFFAELHSDLIPGDANRFLPKK